MILFTCIDLKNIISNGAAFTVNDDIFDKFKFYATIPGYVPAFLIIFIVYQNIHNYNFYVIELITLLCSSILYGWIIAYVVTKVRSKKDGVLIDKVS